MNFTTDVVLLIDYMPRSEEINPHFATRIFARPGLKNGAVGSLTGLLRKTSHKNEVAAAKERRDDDFVMENYLAEENFIEKLRPKVYLYDGFADTSHLISWQDVPFVKAIYKGCFSIGIKYAMADEVFQVNVDGLHRHTEVGALVNIPKRPSTVFVEPEGYAKLPSYAEFNRICKKERKDIFKIKNKSIL